jgi:hypothetical protein
LPGPAFDTAEDPPLTIDRDTDGDGQIEGPQPYAKWSAIVSAHRNSGLMNLNLPYHQAYDNLTIADPEVEFFRVIGDSVNTTPDQIREYNKCTLGLFNCRVVYGVNEANGDGTVPLHSADVYNPAKNFDYRNGIPNAYAHGVNHGALATDDAVLGFVISFFGGTPPATATAPTVMSPVPSERLEPEPSPQNQQNSVTAVDTSAMTLAQINGLSDTPEPFGGVELEALGPLTAYVEDNLGNFLGKLPQNPNDVIYTDIPGSNYFSISDTQILFFNDAGIYTAHLKVTNSTGWRFRVRTYANDQLNGQAVFEVNVPVGAELKMPFTSEPVLANLRLQIDLNADGVIDQEVGPNSIVTGAAAMDQEPPVTNVSVASSGGQCNVTLTAQDQSGGSGVATTYYLLVGISTEPVLYTSPFSVTCGTLVKYMSVDRAGNTELVKEFQTQAPPTACMPSNTYGSSPNGGAKFASLTVANATNFDLLPLSFIPNRGQEDQAVRFHAQGLGGSLFFAPNEVVFSLPNPVKVQADDKEKIRYDRHPANVVRIHYQGANENPEVAALEELPGVVNILNGNNPTKWRKNLPTYSGVAYRELYPGIELRYEGTDGQLKSTFYLAAGANPASIVWRYKGASDLSVDESGNLVISLPEPAGAGITLIEHAPIAWQEVGQDRVMVPVQYALDTTNNNDKKVSFAFPNGYDSTLPLVIDPTLTYSTYLGGGKTDEGHGITLDADCNIYIVGHTSSTNFPTVAPGQTNKPSKDIFVSKLNPAGTTLLYSTYIGGNASDEAWDIALDSQGRMTIVGETESTDFPTLNAYDNIYGGGTCEDAEPCDDVIVTQLTADGSAFSYSTYLGGNQEDDAYALAIGSNDQIYVTGLTKSSTFPTPNGYDTSFGGGTCSGLPCEDAFVVRINPALSGTSSLLYGTFLGGGGYDRGKSIALDTSGRVYVGGYTRSSNYPSLTPYQAARAGDSDAFITKLDTSLSATASLLYSTYFGGSQSDHLYGLTVKSANHVYFTGYTQSTNLPLANAFDNMFGGGTCGTSPCYDVYVTHLDIGSNSLVYSSFLGGSQAEEGAGITVDDSGNAYVTGYTKSTNFNILAAIQPAKAADSCATAPCADAFVTKVNAAGALVYSTYLGGTMEDYGHGIVVDGLGNTYVVGHTFSSNFPGAINPFTGTAGYADAFIVKIDD